MVIAFVLLMWIMMTTHVDARFHALILSTSKYWDNYRHSANALHVYTQLRSAGVPDSDMVLMLADCPACNVRNVVNGKVIVSDTSTSTTALYNSSTQIDYYGFQVTKSAILSHFYQSYPPTAPPSKRILHPSRDREAHSTGDNTLFVYMTGHSGVEFAKLQDYEEISAEEWREAIRYALDSHAFQYILFVADTCRAASLFEAFPFDEYPTRLGAIGSSGNRESSYAFTSSSEVGQATMDGFTYFMNARQSWDHMIRQMGQIGSTPVRAGYVRELPELLATSSPKVPFLSNHAREAARATEILAHVRTIVSN
jgi:phosphatidylinositol glycan class K